MQGGAIDSQGDVWTAHNDPSPGLAKYDGFTGELLDLAPGDGIGAITGDDLIIVGHEIAAFGDHVYLANAEIGSIQQFDLNGNPVQTISSLDPVDPANPSDPKYFHEGCPCGVAVASGGSIFATDTGGRLMKYAADGTFLWGVSHVLGGGAELGRIEIGSDGMVYGTNFENQVYEFDPDDGALVTEIPLATGGGANDPADLHSLAVNGALLVTDYANGRVQKRSHDGSFIANFSTESVGPVDVVVDGFGNVYVFDRDGDKIRRYMDESEAPTCDGATPDVLGTIGDDDIRPKNGEVVAALAGDDNVRYAGPVTACGGAGHDRMVPIGAAGPARLFGDGGNDNLKGAGKADYLAGGNGNDLLRKAGKELIIVFRFWRGALINLSRFEAAAG